MLYFISCVYLDHGLELETQKIKFEDVIWVNTTDKQWFYYFSIKTWPEDG